MRGLFPGTPSPPAESSNRGQLMGFVTTRWPRNIDLVPIDYAFRPRLRDRLTLRRLALRRNPWTFGGSVSHTPLVTHVSIRSSDTSRGPHGSSFTGLRNVPLPLRCQVSDVRYQMVRCRASGVRREFHRSFAARPFSMRAISPKLAENLSCASGFM